MGQAFWTGAGVAEEDQGQQSHGGVSEQPVREA